MATVNYRIKGESKMNSLYVRFKINEREDFELSTKIKIPNGRWSQIKQLVLMTGEIDYKATNEKIQELTSLIMKDYHQSTLDEIIINTKWLREKVDMVLNRQSNNKSLDDSKYFKNFIQLFIQEAATRRTKNNTTIKSRTIQHYQTTLTKIEAYEKHINKRLTLLDIDLQFHGKFVSYLEDIYKLNPNTVGGYIDDVKLFCSNAEKKGIIIKKDYLLQSFYSPTNKTRDIYFDEPTITQIFNFNTDKEYLCNAKDWLIIGLRTGLRISDFLQLSPKNINDEFIEKETLKTEYPVIIPMHPEVQTILNKRNGKFPRKISDQKFNNYIKEICLEMGMTEKIDGSKVVPVIINEGISEIKVHRKIAGKYHKYELVSSHICRRSFATNLYGKIDTLTIMKITGHKTEKQFLEYVKITPRQYAERLKAHWNKRSI